MNEINGWMYIIFGAIVFVIGMLTIRASGNIMERKWYLGVSGIMIGFFLLVVFYSLVIHGVDLIDKEFC